MRVLAMLGLIALLFSSQVGCVTEPGFMVIRPTWSHADFPIHVCASAYVDEGTVDVPEVVSRVIRTIDNRLGFKAFAFATPSEGCSVVAVLGEPVDTAWMDPGGAADIDPVRTRGTRCSIHTANTGTTEILFYVVEHELGHCLGLAHDDWDGSIMRRMQHGRDDEFGPWITDHDRRLLRETYLPMLEGTPE